MQRIFAAVKITPDEELTKLLKRLQTALAKDKIKWVEPWNLHITLKFFGETPEEKVQEIAKALENIARPAAFTLQCTEPGIFGSAYKPRVIWLGINDHDQLVRIGNGIAYAIQSLGYEPDRQNFVPHLTLGRINFLNDKKYFQQIINANRSFASLPQTVSTFHLFESKLRQSGPEYHIIKSYHLNN
jgi:RNA 2',3'-cyclic 3'-phosphodiesterase